MPEYTIVKPEGIIVLEPTSTLCEALGRFWLEGRCECGQDIYRQWLDPRVETGVRAPGQEPATSPWMSTANQVNNQPATGNRPPVAQSLTQ